jgi:hypothetical protein
MTARELVELRIILVLVWLLLLQWNEAGPGYGEDEKCN